MTLTNLLTQQAAAILAHKIVRSEQVRTIEPKAAQIAGCTMFELMQRAGEAAFNVLKREWPEVQSIIVVAGNGNNAGDGYILAKLAKQQGINVVIICEQPKRELIGDAKQAQLEWLKLGAKTLQFSEVDFTQFDVLVDALLVDAETATAVYDAVVEVVTPALVGEAVVTEALLTNARLDEVNNLRSI